MAAIASFLIVISAKRAIHEILAMVYGLSSAVFGVGSVQVFHLNDLPWRIARAMTEEQQRSTAPTAGEALCARSTALRAGR